MSEEHSKPSSNSNLTFLAAMEIRFGKQIDIDEVTNLEIDLFLLAGNHEKRFLTSYNKITKNNHIKKSLMFCYNSSFCKRIPIGMVTKVIKSHSEIFHALDKLLKSYHDKMTIFVDYSCMTKPWYYSIILYLSKKKLSLSSVWAYFSYTPSKYSTLQSPKPNTEILPLPGKYVVPTSKPKALIVCLGYEQQKAEGIIDHLDPKISYIFYTSPALDKRFVKTLENNNKTILNDSTKIIRKYKFDDLLSLERQLTAIYEQLKDDYSIIFAP